MPVVNERLVWIDCEMTGLDLGADALIEVAALVTDFDLNVLGDGIDIIIKPPAEALDQMIDFVRTMHETSGLLDELDGGVTLAEAEEQVLAYLARALPARRAGRRSRATRSPPTAASSPATCPTARRVPALPDRRRLLDQGALAAVVPARLLRRPRPSGATTARSPTSRRASRSCATTATPSSCRCPAPTADAAKVAAERHGGSITGLGPDAAARGGYRFCRTA